MSFVLMSLRLLSGGNTVAERFLALDGNYLLHRVLHIPVFQEMSYRGEPTGGVVGFLRILNETLERFQAHRCFVAWDGGKSRFRVKLFPGYKANRTKDLTEEERKEREDYMIRFRDQQAKVQDILPDLGVRSFSFRGYEGDDAIYLLMDQWRKFRKAKGGGPSVISTEDQDLLQLVGPGIQVHQGRKDQLITKANFRKVVGVPRENYLLYRALIGDRSDGISGVKGVGEKTAASFLKEPMTPSELYEACEQRPDARSRYVVEQWEVVERNLHLMDLSRVPWKKAHITEMRDIITRPSKLDREAVNDQLEEWGIRSLQETSAKWTTPYRRLTR